MKKKLNVFFLLNMPIILYIVYVYKILTEMHIDPLFKLIRCNFIKKMCLRIKYMENNLKSAN